MRVTRAKDKFNLIHHYGITSIQAANTVINVQKKNHTIKEDLMLERFVQFVQPWHQHQH